eukprot:126875-Pyramimonas_sp.AAC.1
MPPGLSLSAQPSTQKSVPVFYRGPLLRCAVRNACLACRAAGSGLPRFGATRPPFNSQASTPGALSEPPDTHSGTT